MVGTRSPRPLASLPGSNTIPDAEGHEDHKEDSDESRRGQRTFMQEGGGGSGEDPHFDTAVPNNLTGLVGKTAYLNCRVKNLGNRTVSVNIPGTDLKVIIFSFGSGKLVVNHPILSALERSCFLAVQESGAPRCRCRRRWPWGPSRRLTAGG
ncbi:hypothetical protein ONE63_000233 [Megalurothrips usitatus]|uniref:Uncharacterized protein n=1 Tax=Megalurothrips usitatus TaxID=439358 RepID=A0AAV7Y1U7_9NEOP|nr:hypothetical protein ONE63_000233 [Megalurothrips usitatus]